MLLKSVYRSRYQPSSILKAAQKYKNSKIQSKMHEFDQKQSKLEEQKKRINYYQTIGRQSEAKIMIRQFLFQERQPTYKVNFPKKYLIPTGKWTLEEIEKQSVTFQGQIKQQGQKMYTQSEFQNLVILNDLSEELKEKLKNYYEKIGKRNYTFSVKEEITKIQKMTKQEFEDFIKKLKE